MARSERRTDGERVLDPGQVIKTDLLQGWTVAIAVCVAGRLFILGPFCGSSGGIETGTSACVSNKNGPSNSTCPSFSDHMQSAVNERRSRRCFTFIFSREINCSSMIPNSGFYLGFVGFGGYLISSPPRTARPCLTDASIRWQSSRLNEVKGHACVEGQLSSLNEEDDGGN